MLVQVMSYWASKLDASIGYSFAGKSTLMHKPVMMATKLYQVLKTRLTAVSPVFYVMAVDEVGVGAAWEAAAVVSGA